MTFYRLLLREIVVPLILTLFLVSMMLVVLQILQLNSVLFGSGFDALGVMLSAVYLAPHFGIIAVPLAFLLAVMLGLGRLAEDNELIAFTALGRSPKSLYIVPIVISLVLGLVVGWLSFEAEPWGLKGIHVQLNEIIKRNVAGDIRPGTFFEEIPRFTVFVDAEREETGKWEHVLLHDTAGDGSPFFIIAQRGEIQSDGDDAVLRLKLNDGELHRATQQGGYARAYFDDAAFALGVSSLQRRQNKFNRPANELRFSQMRAAADGAYESGDATAARRIETAMHGRIASLLTCLVFGLLAVPLAAGGQGARSRAFISAVLAFASYYVLQVVFRSFGESGAMPVSVAAWMPNLIGLCVGGVLAIRLLSGTVAGAGR